MDKSWVKLEKIFVRSKASTCFSKQVVFVPASSDAASIQRRRNDFRVRLNYECADCSENGGSILMLTFTYNNEHLPHLPLLGSLSQFQGIECFRRSDFKRLYNNMRDWCSKKFGVHSVILLLLRKVLILSVLTCILCFFFLRM